MDARRGRSFWAELDASYERSGQTIAAFCERRGVEHGTFRWWRWQLRRAAKPVALVPVVVSAPRPPARAAAIVVAVGDIEVRLGEDTSVETVAALVRALGRPC